MRLLDRRGRADLDLSRELPPGCAREGGGSPRQRWGYASRAAAGTDSPQDAARELPNLPLEDALQLVRLYAERGSPKFEKAAMRWLERYLGEGSPRLKHFAEITASLAKLEPLDR